MSERIDLPPTVFAPGLLKGKSAFVTGGGTGLGKAIAMDLARHGCDVAIASRKPEHVEPAAKEISAQFKVKCTPYLVDIRDADAVEKTVEQAWKEFGGIDILVNNAAGNFLVKAEDLSTNGWRAVLGIVLDGTFYCSKAVGKRMIERGKGGSIVSIVAPYATSGAPYTIHSGAGKAGVLNLMRTLAVEWARYDIRCNAISPGPINTPGARGNLWDDPAAEKALVATVPLGRFGHHGDVSQSTVFLCSPAANYITGTLLSVDGGEWLHGTMFAPVDALLRGD